MFGGDNWHGEETYGAIQGPRRLIVEVLTEKVDDGYFARADAKRLARRILHEWGEGFALRCAMFRMKSSCAFQSCGKRRYRICTQS